MSNPPTAGPGACPGQKVALVTGATPGGIGGALAIQLHKAGFFVVCALRRPSVAESILQPGLVAVALDVASSASVTSAAKEVSSLTDGRLDLLINNAGVATHLPALDLDVDGMVNDMFNVNVLGVMRMVKAFSPLLINSKGTVVNIGSVAPLVPLPFSTAYNATKAALHAYGDGLRMELALFGVKVITIITGGVKSNIVRDVDPALPESSLYRRLGESWLKRVRLSQSSPMSTERYAQIVVKLVSGQRDPLWYWTGGSASLIWAAFYLIPRTWRLKIMARRFGLVPSMKKKTQ